MIQQRNKFEKVAASKYKYLTPQTKKPTDENQSSSKKMTEEVQSPSPRY